MRSPRFIHALRDNLRKELNEYYASRSARKWPFLFRSPFFRSKMRKQNDFLLYLFSMFAKLIRADGVITNDERELLENIMYKELKLSGSEQIFAFRVIREASHTGITFEQYAQEYYECFRHTPLLLENAVFLLFALANADRDFAESEKKLLKAAIDIFGLSEEDYKCIKDDYFRIATARAWLETDSEERYSKKSGNDFNRRFVNEYVDDGPMLQAFRILKLSPGASKRKIKGSYRTLVKKYHPDKLRHKGVPEELLEISREKFHEIQGAYDFLMAHAV